MWVSKDAIRTASSVKIAAQNIPGYVRLCVLDVHANISIMRLTEKINKYHNKNYNYIEVFYANPDQSETT